MQVMAAAVSMQHQWQQAQVAQRKAQNAAKAAKRALARVQQMHEDKGLDLFFFECCISTQTHRSLAPYHPAGHGHAWKS